jgi:hypothetical protein
MATKFGIGQLDTPAPDWYLRLSNALIMLIIPAVGALISGWGFPQPIVTHALQVLLLLTAIIKGIGVFLGATAPPPDSSPKP